MRRLPPKNLAGQALLIVLLSMVVVLTIVLSILSFTVSDIAITSREEEALRAFSAAEAGVERVLLSGLASSGEFESASFEAGVTTLASGAKSFVYPQEISSGDLASFWLVGHDADGGLVCDAEHPCFTGESLKVCWAGAGAPADQVSTPAIEIIIYYAATPGDYRTIQIARATADPNSGRRGDNSFDSTDAGGCSLDGEEFAFQKTINFTDLGIPAASYNTEDGLQLVQVRAIYNTTSLPIGMGVDFPGGALLPAQGTRVDSTGTAGEATRRVEVSKLYADLPPIFSGAIFTPAGITK